MEQRLYEFEGNVYLITDHGDLGEHRRYLGRVDDPWTSYGVPDGLAGEFEALRESWEDGVRARDAYEAEARTYR